MIAKNKVDNSRHVVQLSYFKMMLYSTFTVVSAILLSYLLNEYYPLTITYIIMLEYFGYVCWGTTLGAWGSKILSRTHHESPAEVLDQKLTTFFSMLGIFVFTMSRALESSL